jgi:WD40 repeat protein
VGRRSAVERKSNRHLLASHALSARLAASLELKSEKQNAHSRPICSVAFSPDGKTIVSGSYDQTIKVWGVTSWSREDHLLFSHDVQRRVILLLWLNKRKLLFPDDVLDLLIKACV